MKKIFVFGSNIQGRHGAGSALHAKLHYGAREGIGIGPTGNAYALPTREIIRHRLHTLSLDRIKLSVDSFIKYANDNPRKYFHVVAIGTGYAGYSDAQIAPMFKDAPTNCELPRAWKKLLKRKRV